MQGETIYPQASPAPGAAQGATIYPDVSPLIYPAP
jgi:hypothetical protein